VTDEELFDEFITNDDGSGGRLDTTSCKGEDPELYSSCSNLAKAYVTFYRQAILRLPLIHFDWIASSSVNACAFRHQGRYFIGVTAGAMVLLNALFNRMLSNPVVLPGLGNSAAEDAGRVVPVPLSLDAEVFLAAGAVPVLPTDQTRQAVAVLLQRYCFEFVLRHELTHISHGHVDYSAYRLGIPLVRELGWINGKAQPFLDRQTMEVLADGQAAFGASGNLKLAFDEPTGQLPPPLDAICSHPVDAMFLWAFAVAAFFRVFGDDTLDGVDGTHLLYPPTRVRQINALNLAASWVQREWDKELAEQCAPVLLAGLMEAERAFEIVTGSPSMRAGLTHELDGSTFNHARDVIAMHWTNVLRPALLPFAFTDHLPL
jgi:hypothetical protein